MSANEIVIQLMELLMENGVIIPKDLFQGIKDYIKKEMNKF